VRRYLFSSLAPAGEPNALARLAGRHKPLGRTQGATRRRFGSREDSFSLAASGSAAASFKVSGRQRPSVVVERQRLHRAVGGAQSIVLYHAALLQCRDTSGATEPPGAMAT
jgi:hypothetical protein